MNIRRGLQSTNTSQKLLQTIFPKYQHHDASSTNHYAASDHLLQASVSQRFQHKLSHNPMTTGRHCSATTCNHEQHISARSCRSIRSCIWYCRSTGPVKRNSSRSKLHSSRFGRQQQRYIKLLPIKTNVLMLFVVVHKPAKHQAINKAIARFPSRVYQGS